MKLVDAFGKISFLIKKKKLSKLEMKGNLLNLKDSYKNPTTINIINGNTLNTFPLKSGTMQEHTLTTSIQYHTGRSSYCSRKWGFKRPYRLERNKWNCPYSQTWLTNIENLKTKIKLLELINEFRKVIVNKINTQKSINCTSIY